jgi:hypothetical protein
MKLNEDMTDYDEFRIEIKYDRATSAFYSQAESLAGTVSPHPFTEFAKESLLLQQ